MILSLRLWGEASPSNSLSCFVTISMPLMFNLNPNTLFWQQMSAVKLIQFPLKKELFPLEDSFTVSVDLNSH